MADTQPTSVTPKRKRPASWVTVRRRESGGFDGFYRMGGRTIRAPHRFDSEAEAQAWLATERAAHVTGTWIVPRLMSVAPASAPGVLTLASTFEALCEALIAEEAAFTEARPTYLHDQARLIRRIIVPTLDGVPLGAVKPSLVDAAYQQWHAHRASQARNALVALRQVVKLGKRCDLFTFDMADSIRVHPRAAKEIVTVEPMQLAQFRRTVEDGETAPNGTALHRPGCCDLLDLRVAMLTGRMPDAVQCASAVWSPGAGKRDSIPGGT